MTNKIEIQNTLKMFAFYLYQTSIIVTIKLPVATSVRVQNAFVYFERPFSYI